jgi:hypothetical protein
MWRSPMFKADAASVRPRGLGFNDGRKKAAG